MEDRIAPIHPGEILLEDFLNPMGISAYKLAKSTLIDQTRISEIIRGKRSISVDTALRFSKFFGTSPEFWINIQTHYDLEKKRDELAEDLSRIHPFPVQTGDTVLRGSQVEDSKELWVNHNSGYPKTTGNLEISASRHGVFIGGDPSGLLSLSRLLEWVANADQEAMANIPLGERFHIHLHCNENTKSFNSLNRFSKETQICRLDAKGTGELPEKYKKV